MTADNCLVLSLRDLKQQGALDPGHIRFGVLRWINDDDLPIASSIEFKIDLRAEASGLLSLTSFVGGQEVIQRIRLVSSETHFGGRRWWFMCPLSSAQGAVGHRAMKLYRPPGRHLFASRQHYDLTYASCQTSRRHDPFMLILAQQLQVPVKTLRAGLGGLARMHRKAELQVQLR